MVLNTKQIMEIIPHRQPFLLIDTIEELEPGKRAVGKKCVSYNEPYFSGHFPDEPVMPGVLIVEAMAQAGAVAMLSQPQMKGKTAYFAGIQSAKFKHKVVPGSILELEVEIVKVKGPVGIGKGTAYILQMEREQEDLAAASAGKEPAAVPEKITRKLAASAEIMFAIGSGAKE